MSNPTLLQSPPISQKLTDSEVEALQRELALTRCRCCGRPLNIYTQPGMHAQSPVYQYGTCFNQDCDRYTITRELNDLYNLTAEQVASFTARINA